MVLFAVLC